METRSTIRLETISTDHTKSFSLLFNPRLSDLYFWHYHPAYELVYITGVDGHRQVGHHRSAYSGSDMVLIGSGIPHLNFDYGAKADYNKVVLHLKKELVESHFMVLPELGHMHDLFTRSSRAVVFHDPIKHAIGERLFSLEGLPSGEQYVRIVSILSDLATTKYAEPLLSQPFIADINNRDIRRINAVHRHIDEHYHEKISVQDVASLVGLSKEAFCRYFKKSTGYTFVQFLQRYRVSQAKLLLMEGQTVSAVCFACGFESQSYFNRVFKHITDVNPSVFKRQFLRAHEDPHSS